MDKVSDKGRLREIAGLFLKLGFLSFGGPAAHIAMMEAEVVKKRKWMDADHFLDLIGATNLIPGPNSTEMAMHCGHERAGLRGLVVAGVAFIFQATRQRRFSRFTDAVDYRGSYCRQLACVSDLSESGCFAVWQWLCVVCLS